MRTPLTRPSLLSLLLPVLLIVSFGASAAGPSVTFTKDVAPILYNSCVECHRPGQIGPMPLVSYQDVRPWAKSIRDQVATRAMPPWYADRKHQRRFDNDPSLTQKEIDTIVAWVNAGSPKGDDKDLQAPPKFAEGWTIGEPDAVLSMQEEYEVQADGVVPYLYFTIPTSFTEDKWIQAFEIRPGNRAVVHHVIAYMQEPGAANYDPQAAQAEGERRGPRNNRVNLGGITPNRLGLAFPEGTAKLLKKGSSIVFQMHYTPIGVPARDRTSIGLMFTKGTPEKTLVTGSAANARFVIPAGHPNYEVTSSLTFEEDVKIHSFAPHMHVRGKDFKYTAVYPDGRSEVLLNVPRFDFNWQMTYRMAAPISLPKGTRLDCVAHFDNSTNNKFNPDPTQEVRWGDQTWEEMMIGWFQYTKDAEKLSSPVSTASVRN